MKEIEVFGAEKRSKPWKDMSWIRTCSKKGFGEKSCLGRIMFLRNIDDLMIKEARSFEEMTRRWRVPNFGD